MGQEKRRFKRTDYNTNVKWRSLATPSQGMAVIPDITKDISAGGIRLALYERLETGTRLELELAIGGDKTIKAKGHVKWIDRIKMTSDDKTTVGYYVGIEFTDLSREDKAFIDRFVSRTKE